MIDVLSGESALIKPGSTQRDLFVNGVQCRSTLPLCHGDIIQIGEQFFAYVALLPGFAEDRKTIQFRDRLTSKYLFTIGWLVELTGDKEGRDYRLFPGENRIGSKPGLEVVLFDPEVKERHAVITRHQENWTIVPVSVTDPFHVNGVPSTGTVLQNGDVLRLGQREFMFRACRLAFTK
jgi:pSer/pThr/pTyr-binding forkhead associated (FHA) protein